MTDSRVAKRYARALFNVAKQQNIIPSVDDDLAGITATLSASTNFRSFLKAPQTTSEQKLQVFSKTFGDRITALTLDFVRLLVRKNRDDLLHQVQIEFSNLRREFESVTKIVVTSSEELSDDHKSKILDKIGRQLGQTLEPEFVVDPKLMGGVTVAYDDYVIDGSVRGKLDRLRERMLYDVLKQV